MLKYPRTSHIEGSGLQAGDEELAVVPFSNLVGRFLVVEEKMDGANCAVSFGEDGQLLLQSRGHYLTGGERERQFELLKSWASRYTGELWDVLGARYIMFGEWLYAKHTIFYTSLPHYFLEFDVYDREQSCFLSTTRRADLLAPLRFIVPVRVIYIGPVSSLAELQAMIGPSAFIAPNHRELLRAAALERSLDPDRVLRESDPSGLMEGLYVKIEEEGIVKDRYKYIRAEFLQTVVDSQSHWMVRPLLPNRLLPGVDLFGE